MQAPSIVKAVEFSDRDIFDARAFDADTAGVDRPLSAFQHALNAGGDTLARLFHEGLTAAELVPARARLIDQLLVRAWHRFVDADDSAIALVAVGGYGRGELHPGSDIDIMILLDQEAALGARREAIEGFLTFLWDVGLEVGQSLRTLEDCVTQAEDDVTVATNLMEARLIFGPEPLFQQMRTVTGPDRVWPSGEFFKAKRAEQVGRHQRFHDTAYNLEPNVKEGPGNLRDLQTIGWVAKRHFGAETLHDLVAHGFLTDGEYEALIRSQNFLWRIRFALHVLTGRREDRLLFDHQRQLADWFGYRDEPHNLAIEQFMQRYYRTVMQLSRLNEMLLQLFEEAILLQGEPSNPLPINRRFQNNRGYLEVTQGQVFLRYPFALLELFLIMAQHPELKGVRASTIRLIREHTHLMDETFRNDVRAKSLFMEFLRQPRGITTELRRMNAYGVLAAYLPEFGRIAGRMQYDLFHTYTVDQHTLFVVRNLRRLYLPRYNYELPQHSEVMSRIAKPELLYIAALYHDIAKGRGGDHSQMGAVDAEQFCRRHSLSEFDTRLVVWLVRNHLLMSVTAQKQDPNDPQVVHDFAGQVGDQMYLDHLYLLTAADIRGTNPKLWNSWKEALLRELYLGTRRALRRGLENPMDRDDRIREIQAQARLRLKGVDPTRIDSVWSGFVNDYFLRHTAEEVAWHTRAVLKKADDDRALVLAKPQPGGTHLFIYKRDRDNLFATTTAVLDQLGLTVVDARIITGRSGYTLDSYVVLEADGRPIEGRGRLREIVGRLKQTLSGDQATATPAPRRTPRRLKHFTTATTVSFDRDETNQRTVLEIITVDRPGLLSRIGRAFVAAGVRLQNARIATLGERVEDVFFVTDQNNEPFRDPDSQSRIREMLIATLDESTDIAAGP